MNWKSLQRAATKHVITSRRIKAKSLVLEVYTISKELEKEELSLLEGAGYSRKAIELYGGKVNVGVMENPDVALAYTGPCGDTIKLYLKIGKNDKIEDAKFQYIGCAASAACGSILTQIIKGKTLQEAKKITKDDVLRDLAVCQAMSAIVRNSL